PGSAYPLLRLSALECLTSLADSLAYYAVCCSPRLGRVPSRVPQFRDRNMTQASPGKFNRLPRTPAGSTALTLDGYGLRGSLAARPARDASYPVSVRQVAVLLHASFRHHLAMMPLRFAKPSPPSGWLGDFHPQAIEHDTLTTNPLSREEADVVVAACSPAMVSA